MCNPTKNCYMSPLMRLEIVRIRMCVVMDLGSICLYIGTISGRGGHVRVLTSICWSVVITANLGRLGFDLSKNRTVDTTRITTERAQVKL